MTYLLPTKNMQPGVQNKSYSMVVTVLLGIKEVWGFQPVNITQKPASHFLFNRLAVLVRHSQAQKYLQINP